MILVDKYIVAVGQKLPIKGREEIKRELHSGILDTIEERFGDNPTEENIQEVLKEFGSPREVAERYLGNSELIDKGLKDIYLLILKIVLFALTVSFSVLFILGLFTDGTQGWVKSVFMVPVNVFSTWFTSVGVITIIFMAITRGINCDELKDEWDIKELEEINLDNWVESKAESIFGIVFSLLFIFIINIMPELITSMENLFEKSTMILGHRIDIEVFKSFVPLLTLITLIEIVYYGLVLKNSYKTTAFKVLKVVTAILNIAVLISMLSSSGLFIYNPDHTTQTFVGFRLMFIIGLVGTSLELIDISVKLVKDIAFNKKLVTK